MDQWGQHINITKGLYRQSLVGSAHTYVTVSYWPGKICRTLLVTGWWYTYLSSTLQVSLRRVCQGCWRQWRFHLTARKWSGLGITSRPSLQTQVMFSMSLISNPWSIIALHLKRCFRDRSALWASAISAVVRGYISSLSPRFANLSFMWKQ